jgi:general secretion pathway protein I
MRLPAMPFFCRDRAGASGFSLIEVLVALAIVGLTLAATASVFGTGLFAHTTASDVDTALALAEEKLDAAGVTETLQPGSAEGVFAGRFRWRLVVARYDDKAAGGADPSALGFGLFRIETTIAWDRGWRERRVTLATLRLASAPP